MRNVDTSLPAMIIDAGYSGPTVSKNACLTKFTVEVREPARSRPRITRGQLKIWVEPRQGQQSLYRVKMRGQVLSAAPQGAHREVVIDLAAVKQQILQDVNPPLEIEVVVPDADQMTPDKPSTVVLVHVQYSDPPKPGDRPLFLPSEALILLTFEAQGPSITTTTSTSPGGAGATTASNTGQVIPSLSAADLGTHWKVSPIQTADNAPTWVTDTVHCDLVSGEDVKVACDVTATRFGSGGYVDRVWGANRNLSGRKPGRVQYGLESVERGGDLNYEILGRWDECILTVTGSNYTTATEAEVEAAVRHLFETVAAKLPCNAAPPPPPPAAPQVAVTKKRQDPPPPPPDPAVDDVQPIDGEIVPFPEEIYILPPKPNTPAPEYYTHPTGGYRFRLSPGWVVQEKTMFDEADEGYDTIFSPDQPPPMAIVCARNEYDKRGMQMDLVLRSFRDSMLADDPGARQTRVSVGEGTVMCVGSHEAEDDIMSWHLAVCGKERCYSLSLMMQGKAFVASPPDPLAWMMGSLDLLPVQKR